MPFPNKDLFFSLLNSNSLFYSHELPSVKDSLIIRSSSPTSLYIYTCNKNYSYSLAYKIDHSWFLFIDLDVHIPIPDIYSFTLHEIDKANFLAYQENSLHKKFYS